MLFYISSDIQETADTLRITYYQSQESLVDGMSSIINTFKHIGWPIYVKSLKQNDVVTEFKIRATMSDGRRINVHAYHATGEW